MFCTQCGTNNPEGAAHCVTCGAPMGTSAPRKNDIVSKIKALLSNKFVLLGIGAAALVIILLIVFGGGKTKPIDNFVKGLEKADAKKIMAALPKEMTEELDEDDLEEMLEYITEELEYEFGRNIKISYKVTDEDKWDKDDVEDYAETLEYYYDMDEDKVTEVWTIECDVTIKGSEDKETDEMEFTVFKYKGKWYIDPSNIF